VNDLCAGAFIFLRTEIEIAEQTTQTTIEVNKGIGVEVNTDKTN
jgi:hypothetical protein